jgi:hypothetical protein
LCDSGQCAASRPDWAHGSGGGRSAVRLAARLTSQCNAWSASGSRAPSDSSSRSTHCACSARCASAMAAARWIAACRSYSSLSLDPAAAARSCRRATRSWASAALRKARTVAALACSAAACAAARWRCADASRSLTAAEVARPWCLACSSSIRMWIAPMRCLISCWRRLSGDSGSLSTLPACPAPDSVATHDVARLTQATT